MKMWKKPRWLKINDENEKNEWASAFKVEVKMEGEIKGKIRWWSLQGMMIFYFFLNDPK